MEVHDIDPPVLTLANAPADFAITRDVYESRQAYADPRYSHVLLMHQPTAAERAYVDTLQRIVYAPENASQIRNGRSIDLFSKYYGNSISTNVRADNGGLNSGVLHEYMHEAPGKADFIDRLQLASEAFTEVTRVAHPRWSPSYASVDVLQSPTNVKNMHVDVNPAGVLALFGQGTVMASVALAQSALDAGQPHAREALRTGDLQQTSTGVAFRPDASVTRVADYLFTSAPYMQLFVKTGRGQDNVPGYKPSTHAFSWRNSKMGEQRDIRMRSIIS